MKKILFTALTLLIASLPSFAVITPEEAASQNYIENHGYSSEMARLVDLQKMQTNNVPSKYVKPREAWQDVKLPKWCTEKRVDKTRRAFQYLDCGLDDGKFGSNKIKPSSSVSDL